MNFTNMMIKQIKYDRSVKYFLHMFDSLSIHRMLGTNYYLYEKSGTPLLFTSNLDIITIRYERIELYNVSFGLSALEIAEIIINHVKIKDYLVRLIYSDTSKTIYEVTDYKFKLSNND